MRRAAGLLRSNRGMTLVETVLAMGVLLVCAMVFSATFPAASHARERTGDRSKAVSLASRQLEAARDAGYDALLTYSGCAGAGLVNTSQQASPYVCTSVTFGSGQSIANSLPGGAGTMSVDTVSPELLRVTVTVTWQDGRATRSTTLSTLIAST